MFCFCLLRYTGTHAMPVVKHTAQASDEAVSESISELRHQPGRYFTGSLTPSGLWVAVDTLPALADSCTEPVKQHLKYSLSTSTEHWKNSRIELDCNSAPELWGDGWTWDKILGHRNQIKYGKWNRGSKLSCYLCKLGLHLLLGNEEEGGKTVFPSVQQQAQ